MWYIFSLIASYPLMVCHLGDRKSMMAQRQQVLVLTDGEKLTILIARDGRDIDDIASAWGRTRVQIWRYQNSEKLKPVVIQRACEVLGVPESIFDPRLNTDSLLQELDRMQHDIENLNHRVHILEAEKTGLSDAIKILNTPAKKEGNN